MKVTVNRVVTKEDVSRTYTVTLGPASLSPAEKIQLVKECQFTKEETIKLLEEMGVDLEFGNKFRTLREYIEEMK